MERSSQVATFYSIDSLIFKFFSSKKFKIEFWFRTPKKNHPGFVNISGYIST